MQVQQFNKLPLRSILVITLRFLGDTLLTTPLINSLKQAYPEAAIDVLTYKSNVGMLEGNPAINQVIGLESKPSFRAFLRLLLGLFRKYDLSISTQAGDRPVLAAILTGKKSLGFIPEEFGKAWWKKLGLTGGLVFKYDYSHAVLENLRFCHWLGIKPLYKLIPPKSPLADIPNQPYIVVHIIPQWRYKEWHMPGWHDLIEFIGRQDVRVVLTGSGSESEQLKLQALKQTLSIPVLDLAGQLSLGQIAELIAHAKFFIGPDTGITHLAAATGTFTFAIFGPTDPQKWAPWPSGYTENTPPFASQGSKVVGNVSLIQGVHNRGCVPCQLEGCENNRTSHSECLDGLHAKTVINTIKVVYPEFN